MSEYQLDARRMLCPMPVIKTQNKVKELVDGDILNITCTDPGALNDIPAWARINGHHFIGSHESDGELVLVIRVGS